MHIKPISLFSPSPTTLEHLGLRVANVWHVKAKENAIVCKKDMFDVKLILFLGVSYVDFKFFDFKDNVIESDVKCKEDMTVSFFFFHFVFIRLTFIRINYVDIEDKLN